jgi:MFS family permease
LCNKLTPITALFGYFADHCRLRRLPFIVGLIALGASTGLFVVARSLPVLIIARGLQGFSGAAVWVVGLAIIADNVPPDRVAEAMGHTSIALTWGALLGPTIGGVMYEKLGYYGTFAIPAGLIMVDVVLRFAMIEESGKGFAGSPYLFWFGF